MTGLKTTICKLKDVIVDLTFFGVFTGETMKSPQMIKAGKSPVFNAYKNFSLDFQLSFQVHFHSFCSQVFQLKIIRELRKLYWKCLIIVSIHSSSSDGEASHNSPSHNNPESDDNGEIVAKYSVAILDIPSHGEVCANTIDLPPRSHSPSPVDIIESTLIPVLQTSSDCISFHNTPNSHMPCQSPCSGKSSSRSPIANKLRSRQSRSPSARSAHSSRSCSSRSSIPHSKSPSVSSRSRSRSKSRSKSRSRSNSSSGSSSSTSSRSARSIPRRRGSPSFLERRRITRYESSFNVTFYCFVSDLIIVGIEA